MPKYMVKLESNYVRTHLLKTRYHNEAVLFIAFWVCDACAVYQGRWRYLMYVKSCTSLFWKLIFSTTKRLDIKRYHDPKKFFAYLISFVCFECVCVCSMGVLLRSCYEFQNHITMYMYISLCKTNVWYGKKMSKNLFHTALSFGGQIDHSTLYISFVPLVAIFREYTRFLTRALLLRGL